MEYRRVNQIRNLLVLTSILGIWKPLEIMFKLVHVSFIIYRTMFRKVPVEYRLVNLLRNLLVLTSILGTWKPLEIMFKLVHVSFIIC